MNPKNLQKVLKESKHLEPDGPSKAKKEKKSFKERVKSLFIIRSNREKKTKNLRVRNHVANAEPIETPEVIKASPKKKFQRFLDLFKRKRRTPVDVDTDRAVEGPKVSRTASKLLRKPVGVSTKVLNGVARRPLPEAVEGCNTQDIVARKANESSTEANVDVQGETPPVRKAGEAEASGKALADTPASTDDGETEMDDIPSRPCTSMAFNIDEDPSRAHLKPMLRPKTPSKPKLSKMQEIFKIKADQLRAEEKRVHLMEKRKESLPNNKDRVDKNQELLRKMEAERKRALDDDIIRKEKNKHSLDSQKISNLKTKSTKVALAHDRVKVEKAARIYKKKMKMERKMKTAQERKNEMLADKLQKLKSRHSHVEKLCKDKADAKEAGILAAVRDFNSCYGMAAKEGVITKSDPEKSEPKEEPMKSVSVFIANPEDRPITPALSRFPYYVEDDRPITPANPSICCDAVDAKKRRSRKSQPKTATGERTPHEKLEDNAETKLEAKKSSLKTEPVQKTERYAEDDRPITPANPSIYRDTVDAKKSKLRKSRPKKPLVSGERTVVTGERPSHEKAEHDAGNKLEVKKSSSKTESVQKTESIKKAKKKQGMEKGSPKKEVVQKVDSFEKKSKDTVAAEYVPGRVKSLEEWKREIKAAAEASRPVKLRSLADIYEEEDGDDGTEAYARIMAVALSSKNSEEPDDEFEELMTMWDTPSVHSEKSSVKSILIPKGGLPMSRPKKHVTFNVAEKAPEKADTVLSSYAEVIARAERKERIEKMKAENKRQMALPKKKGPGQFDYRQFLHNKIDSYSYNKFDLYSYNKIDPYCEDGQS